MTVLPLDHAAAVGKVLGRSRWLVTIHTARWDFVMHSYARTRAKAKREARALFALYHPDVAGGEPEAVEVPDA